MSEKIVAKRAKMSATETAFKAILIVFGLLMPVIGFLVIRFQQSQVILDNGTIFAYSDIPIILASMLLTHFLRRFFRDRVPFITTLIDDVKTPDLADRRVKAEDVASKAASFIHYSTATGFYYWAFLQQDNLPICMGGQSNCDSLFSGFPYPQAALAVTHLKSYYLVQYGANAYKLLYQAICKRDSKTFYEYTLHHFLTTFLIGFSYSIHALKMGSFIMLFHDASDVLFLLSRIYYELKGKKIWLMVPFNIMSIVGWVYCRLYVLPMCALRTLYFGKHFQEDYPYREEFFVVLWLEISMLTMLLFMNFVWTYLIFSSLFNLYTKKLFFLKKNK